MALSLSLQPVLDSALRCAWCHASLEDGEPVACPECRTLTHAECSSEARGCLTLGCAGPRRTPRIRVLPRRRPWLAIAGVVLAGAVVLTGVTTLFAFVQDMEVTSRVAVPSSPEMSALLQEVHREDADPEIVARVVALVGAEPRHHHMVAAIVIAERQSPDTIPALRQAWQNELAWDVRRWILRVLMYAGPRAFEALPEILEGVADPELRDQALSTLSHLDFSADHNPAGAETRDSYLASYDLAEPYAEALTQARR